MSSGPPPRTPTAATLQSLRDELKGNIIRNVNGLFAKNFEGKSRSAVVQSKLQDTQSAKIISKLCAGVPDIARFDSLLEWLAHFQTLLFAAEQAGLHFQSQPLSSTGGAPGAAISLETSGAPSISGSTRVFGEFHHDNTPLADDDDDTLRFCEHAHHVLKTQSARCFVHGFLVRGTTLELWIFDRSGAYSSERLDLAQAPDLLVRTLAGYVLMDDEKAGFNTFVKHGAPGSDGYVTFHHDDKFYLRPEPIAMADYIVGPGTSCYAASVSTVGEPDTVIKFSWREDKEPTEVRLLEQAHKRNACGVVQLVGHQDLVSIADLRQGLKFPQPFVPRTFSCVATTPLGRPIREYTSIPELLEVLRDLVKALQSLYVNARILHRDVAIKNLIIAPQHSADGLKAPVLSSQWSGQMDSWPLASSSHTYRHDLESLLYVFLWIAIANDRVRDEANDILEGMPKTSRLWKWCTMDFCAVGRDKAADMRPEGFEGILGEFSSDFASLQGLARELHALIFPVRDGEIFTGIETDQVAVQKLYNGIAAAFDRSARALYS
ncbi:hypothetical protein QBC34DRAFT_472521 [Podospora aff. communis PSN243]|uniref:non-specific serine/threonine protein kinase n=1 Tax=Podospora aff. communis PSN243 TaxID=3040156 RepID=A0AAV9GB20_9PEZI|nr:hypothetical protein QBC34DRAFT_472521 [Podospora aff. communis PSN243]